MYLKHQYGVFYEIEKGALEMFVARLSFALYKPGEIVAKAGEPCTAMTMFIDGEVDALHIMPDAKKIGHIERMALQSESNSLSGTGQTQQLDGHIQTYKQGDSIGEQSFEDDYN